VFFRTGRAICCKLITVALVIVATILSSLALAQDNPKKNVLILNSYNNGYKWTDNIVEGITSVLEPSSRNLNIIVEDMDRKRITDESYVAELFEVYKYKFKTIKFDVIICSDDDAFYFLLQYHDQLFPGTPIVFCGVNYFQDSILQGEELFTGVVEAQDIRATISLALTLHPNTKDIYIVNDKSTTGLALEKDLQQVLPQFADRVRFVSLADCTMGQVRETVKTLPDDSLVLYLVFFRDAANQYFNYDESIALISAQSRVPIYGCWDFSLGHGIVGGMLTSGFYQGEAAAKMALRILDGERPADIPVLKDSPNKYMFDASQMKRYGVKNADLPENSFIINDTYSDSKQVLILNSYHHGMSWTDSIEEGIKSVLADQNISLYIDYMDAKRNNGPEFTQKLHEVYKEKYGNKKFDAVIATDDPAYNFLLKYHNELFKDVPVVFCGVNYFNESSLAGHPLFTGIVEAIDIRKTLEAALRLHPGVGRVVVINDKTPTGLANKKLLQEVIPDFPGVEFVLFEGMNMSELQDKVEQLPVDSLILLLTYNQDKSNNVFSYEQSAELIAQKARVPIYSVWEFYLGHGILGGLLTSGYSQGEMAGKMALRILNGEQPAQIPVVNESPNRYMFDYNQMIKFGLIPGKLPPESIVINQPVSFYEKHIVKIGGTFAAIIITVLLIQRKRAQDQMKYYATTDAMTGVFNRRTGLAFLEKQMEIAKRSGEKLSICFVDVNNLKMVNDTYGHQEGDYLIKTVSQLLQQPLRKSDVICRLGGDEFLLIFPGVSISEAEVVWRRIEDAIANHNTTAGKPFAITVSHGFAGYDRVNAASVDEFILIADKEMYQEKNALKSKGCYCCSN